MFLIRVFNKSFIFVKLDFSTKMKFQYNSVIKSVECFDVRFPTSLKGDGSDAMHTDPDYSVCYVVICLNDRDIKGFGLTFTLGRGTEIVRAAVNSMKFLLENVNIDEIFNGFGKFWRKLTSESQLRWLGPEKGVMHLAAGALINGLWDLWGRLEGKPVWQLLTDMEPEVSDLIKHKHFIL